MCSHQYNIYIYICVFSYAHTYLESVCTYLGLSVLMFDVLMFDVLMFDERVLTQGLLFKRKSDNDADDYKQHEDDASQSIYYVYMCVWV